MLSIPAPSRRFFSQLIVARPMFQYLFITCGLALSSSVVAAQDDPRSAGLTRIEPDRRDFTTGTGIVSVGHLQLEGGMDWQHSDVDRQLTLGEVTFRIPLASDVEMHLALPSYIISHDDHRQTGLDDTDFELRYRFYNGSRVDWAIQTAIIAPTGSREVAQRDWQPGVTFASSIKLSDRIGLVTSLGGKRATVDGTRFAQVVLATSLRVDVAASWNLFGELYGFNRETPDGTAHKYADLGAVYFPTESVAFDARIGRGISNGESTETIASVGASRRF
jgi:hypothetical protein